MKGVDPAIIDVAGEAPDPETWGTGQKAAQGQQAAMDMFGSRK